MISAVVGKLVGSLEGCDDGCELGLLLGMQLGCPLGCPLGSLLGPAYSRLTPGPLTLLSHLTRIDLFLGLRNTLAMMRVSMAVLP